LKNVKHFSDVLAVYELIVKLCTVLVNLKVLCVYCIYCILYLFKIWSRGQLSFYCGQFTVSSV